MAIDPNELSAELEQRIKTVQELDLLADEDAPAAEWSRDSIYSDPVD